MADTPYHGEAKPEPGGDEGVWGDKLNDLIDYYDGRIELRGTLAERPTASEVPEGVKYRVDQGDEQGSVFINTDSGWALQPVKTDSIVTDELKTDPTGTFVQLNGGQDVANDTLTDIAFETETSRGQVSNLLDETANEVVIPSGFDWAFVTLSLDWATGSGINVDLFDIQMNGSDFAGQPRDRWSGDPAIRTASIASGWIPVNAGDAITGRVRQQEGSTQTVNDSNNTWMKVGMI